MKFEIEHIDEETGKGLICTQIIQKDELIFTEDPLVSAQFLWSKTYGYKACDYCLKSLETATEMARRLTQSAELKLPQCDKEIGVNIVSCSNCDTVFCSDTCQSKAWKSYHKFLCSCSPYVNFKCIQDLEELWRNTHFPPETSSISFVLKIIANVELSENPIETIKTYQAFCSSTQSHNTKLNHKLLGDKFENQIELLRENLQHCFTNKNITCAQWLTKDGFSNLLAMLGTNQQGIGTSRIDAWVRKCDKLQLSDQERKDLDDFIDKLYADMYEVSGEFLNCEGSGLYSLQSCCNHSCEPNAEVEFLQNQNTLTLRSTKEIVPGEEIRICYVSECQRSRSRHTRQKYLKQNYLFECTCPKCVAEENQPDVTSSESETDGENEG